MNAVACLETMWDWRAMTSSAGYREEAPRWFVINNLNHTGKRLYDWLGPGWHGTVTNACPDLVYNAKYHGKPDPEWLANNLADLSDLDPIDVLLVCGKVAQKTYERAYAPHEELRYEFFGRVLFVPHPAARMWTRAGLERTKRLIQRGNRNLEIQLSKQGLRVKCLTA